MKKEWLGFNWNRKMYANRIFDYRQKGTYMIGKTKYYVEKVNFHKYKLVRVKFPGGYSPTVYLSFEDNIFDVKFSFHKIYIILFIIYEIIIIGLFSFFLITKIWYGAGITILFLLIMIIGRYLEKIRCSYIILSDLKTLCK